MPPDTTTATTPASPPAGGITQAPAAAAPAAGATSAPWYGDVSDPDLKGWVELKKPGDPLTALKGWRDSEKLIGAPAAELLRIPKADATPQDWEAFYDRLGRPKDPTEYNLQVPMGDDGAFAAAIAPILREAGITPRQAQILNEKWNAMISEGAENEKAQADQQSQADILNLKREWGNSYDSRVEMGRRALRQFGTEIGGTPDEQRDELLKLENYMGGSAKMLKLFAAIGSKLGEGNFIDGAPPKGFEGMTPAAAGARIKELFADDDWRGKYIKGGAQSAQGRELDALQRIQASGAKAA